MKKTLWLEFLKMTAYACLIFAALLGVSYLLEWAIPAWGGQLLQWHSPAFLVGIPASIIGTAYVLTIRNPKNYVGFVGGITMSLFLGGQFYLLGAYDLLFMQICIFVPFMTSSLLRWRKRTLREEHTGNAAPQFLRGKSLVATLLIATMIVATDYALITLVMQHNAWDENILLKLTAAVMFASSVMANFWMIYQKLDAWVWWIIHSVGGMLFYILENNIFSLLYYTVCLVVNGIAFWSWLKILQSSKKKAG